MANTMKLVMTFNCNDDKEHNFSWKYAKELPRTNDVKALGQALITNGSIFAYVPVELLAAKVVVTSENEIDITD